MSRPLLALLLLTTACQSQDSGETAPEAPQPGSSQVVEPQAVPEQTLDPAADGTEQSTIDCGADRLGRWLNVLPTETVKAQIRETVGHDRIRYVAPGEVITQDLRSDRLNVETGADGRIKRFRCY